MLLNIIDRRKRLNRWKFVDAIIEPTWHDNSCEDSDVSPRHESKEWMGYDERFKLSLADAIKWAQEHPDNVTLFIYDVDGNTIRRVK